MSSHDIPLAVYPGTFDPITNGHVDIVNRALKVFPKVIVAVSESAKKHPLFSLEERVALVRECFSEKENVEADGFNTLLVDYLKKKQATVVIRGLRAVSDFEFEFQMANMNSTLAPKVETLFMMTGQKNFYISANIVREVAALGGKVNGMVPPHVEKRLKEKLNL